MRAAVFEQFQGPLQVVEVPSPDPLPDAAIIRVEACGICRSDWHGWMGHDGDVNLPHVPGHELVGVVEAIGGEVSSWRPGQRVTTPFCCGCGNCHQCAQGYTHICDQYAQPGFTHWGAFAEYVQIRYADVNLVEIPEAITSVEAASMGCRFATAYWAVVKQASLKADDTLVVHGCGGVGLSAILIAASVGARVIAVDISDAQLDLALACGADEKVNGNDCRDVPQAIRDLTTHGASVSIDALGSHKTCIDSVRCLSKRGRHVQIGLMLADQADPAVPMAEVIGKELRLLGSHGMPARHYPEMLQQVETGALNLKKLVGDTVSLIDACEILPNLNRFQSVGATVINHF